MLFAILVLSFFNSVQLESYYDKCFLVYSMVEIISTEALIFVDISAKIVCAAIDGSNMADRVYQS